MGDRQGSLRGGALALQKCQGWDYFGGKGAYGSILPSEAIEQIALFVAGGQIDMR